ncbi:Hypothetical predicted protein [Mytilus galloprovincialis]|uniref:Uncharacterized protein n=1 Tax=Mytilus galloprovincialis TaxID=29158 RepID=A0A8B6BI04_MYTGA|nr:Hypothetical predicted protein [Mytilus galloprovincialis]
MLKQRLYLNRPIYVGFTILDLSKTLMYDFHYNYMKDKYGSRVTLLFTDTDLLRYNINTDDIYQNMMENKHLFDTSEYNSGHRLHSTLNKKVLGKTKDETHGIPIHEFVGLKSKMYSSTNEENETLCEKKTAKDDLMRDVINSKDVCELFVECSHHRNLSVACILQNAFSKGKKSRTMNINSQFIVLFKNPRDQVGPATFARQMYPNNPKKFMNKYKEGTQQPYESLFIDLKQNTPEDDRLKLNVFENKNMVGGGVSKEYISRKVLEPPQFEESFQSQQTYLQDEKEIMPSCDDYGVVFESVPDLARHMNNSGAA